MITYIFTLAITFFLLLLTAVLISYCKRRQSRTSHGLTGMCHKSGGAMNSCCSAQYLNQSAKGGKTTACRQPTKDSTPVADVLK